MFPKSMMAYLGKESFCQSGSGSNLLWWKERYSVCKYFVERSKDFFPEGFHRVMSAISAFLLMVTTGILLMLSKFISNPGKRCQNKMNLCSFKSNHIYLGPLYSSNVGDFSWCWIPKASREREEISSSYVHVIRRRSC